MEDFLAVYPAEFGGFDIIELGNDVGLNFKV